MYNKFSGQYIGTTYSSNNWMTRGALKWCELFKLCKKQNKPNKRIAWYITLDAIESIITTHYLELYIIWNN